MSFEVFLIVSAGMPQDHHAIFVETHADGSGHTYQVTGNIQQGQRYESKDTVKPEDDLSYFGKQRIGSVRKAEYDQIEVICANVIAPCKQFDGPARMYPTEPLRRCQEWTQEAIQALKNANVLREES